MSVLFLVISLFLVVGGIWLTFSNKKAIISDDFWRYLTLGTLITVTAKILGAPKREKELSPLARKIAGIILVVTGLIIAFSYLKSCGFPLVSSICDQ